MYASSKTDILFILPQPPSPKKNYADSFRCGKYSARVLKKINHDIKFEILHTLDLYSMIP